MIQFESDHSPVQNFQRSQSQQEGSGGGNHRFLSIFEIDRSFLKLYNLEKSAGVNELDIKTAVETDCGDTGDLMI